MTTGFITGLPANIRPMGIYRAAPKPHHSDMKKKAIRWRSLSKPPTSGTVYLRGTRGVYVVQAYHGGWIGNVPGWESITGWRRSDPTN